jgi:hypothetical protein
MIIKNLEVLSVLSKIHQMRCNNTNDNTNINDNDYNNDNTNIKDNDYNNDI